MIQNIKITPTPTGIDAANDKIITKAYIIEHPIATEFELTIPKYKSEIQLTAGMKAIVVHAFPGSLLAIISPQSPFKYNRYLLLYRSGTLF